jgi:hypothetical protein
MLGASREDRVRPPTRSARMLRSAPLVTLRRDSCARAPGPHDAHSTGAPEALGSIVPPGISPSPSRANHSISVYEVVASSLNAFCGGVCSNESASDSRQIRHLPIACSQPAWLEAAALGRKPLPDGSAPAGYRQKISSSGRSSTRKKPRAGREPDSRLPSANRLYFVLSGLPYPWAGFGVGRRATLDRRQFVARAATTRPDRELPARGVFWPGL